MVIFFQIWHATHHKQNIKAASKIVTIQPQVISHQGRQTVTKVGEVKNFRYDFGKNFGFKWSRPENYLVPGPIEAKRKLLLG